MPRKKSTSILGKAKPVSELALVITALFYGRSGTGKTTISGSFPKPLLLIDIGEKGTDSLSGEDGVDVIRVSDWNEMEEIYWELKDGDHNYKSVVVDAVHSMQGLALTEAKLNSGKKLTDQTSQRDFGQASGLMNTWLFNYRDLADEGMHIVFLAHDKVQEHDTDDDSDMILPEVGPRLMPSVASALLGAVNVVGNTYIREIITKSKKVGDKAKREVQYCLRIGPHGYYATKIRRPKDFTIPEFIVDPTYDKLANVIQGKASKATASQTQSKRKIRRRR